MAQLESDAEGVRFLYEAEVREWAQRELEARGGRRKSLTLLQGTLAFTSHAPTVKVTDPGAAMEKAQELGCLRVDAQGYQKAAMQAFRETGELLPGVEAVAERETFAARFPKTEADRKARRTPRPPGHGQVRECRSVRYLTGTADRRRPL